MSRRLVILTEIISPYRIPLFNALAKEKGIDLHVIFLSETDASLRRWHVYKQEIEFSYEVLPSWRKRISRYNILLNFHLSRALRAAAPDVILCGGYSYVASWQTLFWAKARGVPFLLWSESNQQDMRRGHSIVEILKDAFLRKCRAFVVPGRSAAEYLRTHKIEEGIIFTAPNAVDNGLFASVAATARSKLEACRSDLALPQRYVLFVGRLVPEKGVFDLIAAYAKLSEGVRAQVGLVFVGDGVSRQELEQLATSISPGTVSFAGFVQRDQLPAYYALAEMLILPTYTDTWGLVVNEAMACGLPVVVSRVAGCSRDLVREDWNGVLVPPGDVLALTAAMERLVSDPEGHAIMGTNSAQHISHYSPEAWSGGIRNAVASIGAGR
jgi:glycosyltransferase involved in cell wall biosynthesis